MGFFDKMCGKIGLTDPEEEKLDQAEAALLAQEKAEKEEAERVSMNYGKNDDGRDNVVSFHASTVSSKDNVISARIKVIVIEPKSFDDAQQVANNLREKKPVVINFEKTAEKNIKQRIIDFIGGTIYAIDGEIRKVGNDVFLCTPNNVNVAVSDDNHKSSAEMPWLRK